MDLIDTNIKPDPFDPQRGDVYESGGPFPQRIVVEIPPRSEDQRIRYRVDGGADSNLTTLGQFHLHLAGLGEIRGVGRVREYPPIAPDEASAEDLLLKTAYRFSVLIDAVVGPGAKDPRSDADLVRIATNARQVSDQVGSAICLLGYKWDESTEDAGHALIEAVRAERKVASDLALELDSISALIAPHGVTMPAGSNTKPTSLELVRWLAVTGGVVPHACHPTLAEVQEAQQVDFRARWDRYASTKREPAFGEPARPEVGEVDHFPSVAETRALGLRAEVHRTVAQLRDLSLNSQWPIRERLQSAAAVMLAVLRERDLVNAATLCTLPPGGANESADLSSSPIYCTGFVTILAVKDRRIVQRQSWTSARPGFKPTDVSFHDDDPRFAAADALAFGDCQGTWTWQGRCYFADKPQWQGEWTEEKT